MIQDDSLIEPIDIYTNELKEKVKENASSFLDELIKKSKVDENDNILLNKRIEKHQKEKDDNKKLLNKVRASKAILIIDIILLIIAYVVLLYKAYLLETWIIVVLGVITASLVIFMILGIKNKIQPKIEKFKTIISDLDNKINRDKNDGYKQLSQLSKLFDYDMPNIIVKKTTPLIDLDLNFNPERYSMLHDLYGYNDNDDINSSTVHVQSGTIKGNPFVLERQFNTYLGTKTYYGSIVIHWTTTETDSEGHSHIVHHTETLTASVTKPCPYYHYQTYMIYGNEAAPKLIFSRNSQQCSSYDDDKLEKYCKKYENKLDKLTKKATNSETKNFTRLANTKFEACFNALDRNDEVEFRLLFTPLAQSNMVKLLRSNEGFGDDFRFKKNKKINIISSSHSQNFNYCMNLSDYYHYDIRVIKQRFISYTTTYFKCLYFDLAPLLSIPEYQQHKSLDYIYGKNYLYNTTTYEHEIIANSYTHDEFRPKNCDTQYIIKDSGCIKDKSYDRVKITSYGYKQIPKVDMIPVLGGDGDMHLVPVEYFIYEPVKSSYNLSVTNTNIKQSNSDTIINKNNSIIVKRGILSYLGIDDSTLENDINNIIKDIKEDK